MLIRAVGDGGILYFQALVTSTFSTNIPWIDCVKYVGIHVHIFFPEFWVCHFQFPKEVHIPNTLCFDAL